MRTRHIVTTAALASLLAGGARAAPGTAPPDGRLTLSFAPEPAPRNLYTSPFDHVTLRAREEPAAPKTPAAPTRLRLTLLPARDAEAPLPQVFVPDAPLDFPATPAEPIPFGAYRLRLDDVGFSLTIPTGRVGDPTGYRDRIDGTPQQSGFSVNVSVGRCEPR